MVDGCSWWFQLMVGGCGCLSRLAYKRKDALARYLNNILGLRYGGRLTANRYLASTWRSHHGDGGNRLLAINRHRSQRITPPDLLLPASEIRGVISISARSPCMIGLTSKPVSTL